MKYFKYFIAIYLSQKKPEFQGTSPVQTSKHATVRHEIAIFSEYLDTIRENKRSFTKR